VADGPQFNLSSLISAGDKKYDKFYENKFSIKCKNTLHFFETKLTVK